MLVCFQLIALALFSNQVFSFPSSPPSNNSEPNDTTPISSNLPYNKCVGITEWTTPDADPSEVAAECEIALVQMEDMLEIVGTKVRCLVFAAFR